MAEVTVPRARNGILAWVDKFFEVSARGSTLGIEFVGGLTTFMVMAYIIFVNPIILNFVGDPNFQDKGLGPGFLATVAATCLTAGVLTIAMGLLTNYPLAMAPGMGLNAVVAYQLIVGMGLTWQEAMGVILLEGIFITVLVLTGLREAMIEAIPLALKQAIGVGIGIFILYIGLYTEARFIQQGVSGTGLVLGNFTTLPVGLALFGLALMVLLTAKKVRGALLIGILITTLVGVAFQAITGLSVSTVPGAAALPAQLVSLPDFSTFGQGINFGVFAKAGFLSAILTILSIMLSDYFDTAGTVMGIGSEVGWLDKLGKLPRSFAVFLVDSFGPVFGGAASASSNTTYIESAAGIAAGARTGLTSVVVGALFLAAIFFSPITAIVPPEATAGALIMVGFYMCTIIAKINWADFAEGLPALLTIVVMPATSSITDGIGAGFIAYTFIKLMTGKSGEVHWMMKLSSLAFVIYFALPLLRSVYGF